MITNFFEEETMKKNIKKSILIMTAAVFASTAMFAASPKVDPKTKLDEKRAMEKLLDDAFGANVKKSNVQKQNVQKQNVQKPKVEIKVEIKPEVKHEVRKEVTRRPEHVRGPEHRKNHKHDNCVHGHRGRPEHRTEIKNHHHKPAPVPVKPHVQPKKPVKAHNDR